MYPEKRIAPRGQFLFRHAMRFVRVALFLVISGSMLACESGIVRQVEYYQQVGDSESARQFLEAELRRRPDNSEARYLLGKVLFSERDFAAGRQAFDQVEQQTARFSDPIQYLLESSYRAHVQQGIDALEANEATLAEVHFRYATEIRPEYNPGHRLLGFALTQIGRLDDAKLACQQAVMVDPDDLQSWNNLSEIAYVQQDFERAREFALEARKLDPQNVTAIRRLAHACVNLHEKECATSAFEELLEMNSGVEDVRSYAFFLFNTGDFEASLPHLEKLVTAGEPSMELLKTLSETYAGLQQFKKVIAVNEEILSRQPEDRTAIGNLIAAHEKLGQFDQAKNWQSKLALIGGEM